MRDEGVGNGSAARRRLPDVSPMHEVEVWCTFTLRWVAGFWLDHLDTDSGAFLRRSPDGIVIGPVDPTRLRQRPERTRTPGWGSTARPHTRVGRLSRP